MCSFPDFGLSTESCEDDYHNQLTGTRPEGSVVRKLMRRAHRNAFLGALVIHVSPEGLKCLYGRGPILPFGLVSFAFVAACIYLFLANSKYIRVLRELTQPARSLY